MLREVRRSRYGFSVPHRQQQDGRSPEGRFQRRLLADEAFDVLLEQLLDGQLPPESPLNIDALARSLGVSQTPIREALARLEATGLVHRAALRGYTVAPSPTFKELSDLMDARIVIEPVNARLAAVHLTDESYAQIAEVVERMAEAPTGPSYHEFHEYWDADQAFHSLIAQHANNHYLLTAYNSLGGLAQRFRQFIGTGVTDAQAAVAEHRVVLAALATRDGEQAHDAMLTHVRNVKQRSLTDLRRRAETTTPSTG